MSSAYKAGDIVELRDSLKDNKKRLGIITKIESIGPKDARDHILWIEINDEYGRALRSMLESRAKLTMILRAPRRNGKRKRNSSALVTCQRCEGAGDCPACDGRGRLEIKKNGYIHSKECIGCRGSGDCIWCRGSGKHVKMGEE